jgi:hypothetical protein
MKDTTVKRRDAQATPKMASDDDIRQRSGELPHEPPIVAVFTNFEHAPSHAAHPRRVGFIRGLG